MKVRIVLFALGIVSYSLISVGDVAFDPSMIHTLEASTSFVECLDERDCFNSVYRPGTDAVEKLDIALFRKGEEGFKFVRPTNQGKVAHPLFNSIGLICGEPAQGESELTVTASADFGSTTQGQSAYCGTFSIVGPCEVVTAQHVLFPKQELRRGRTLVQRQNIMVGWGFPKRPGISENLGVNAFPNRASIGTLQPNPDYFPRPGGAVDDRGNYYVDRNYDCVTATIKNCDASHPAFPKSSILKILKLNRYSSKYVRNCRTAGFEAAHWSANGEVMLHKQCRNVGDSLQELYPEKGWQSFCSSGPGASGAPIVCDIVNDAGRVLESGIVGFSSRSEVSETVANEEGKVTTLNPSTVIDINEYGPGSLDGAMNTIVPAGNCGPTSKHVEISL